MNTTYLDIYNKLTSDEQSLLAKLAEKYRIDFQSYGQYYPNGISESNRQAFEKLHERIFEITDDLNRTFSCRIMPGYHYDEVKNEVTIILDREFSKLINTYKFNKTIG